MHHYLDSTPQMIILAWDDGQRTHILNMGLHLKRDEKNRNTVKKATQCSSWKMTLFRGNTDSLFVNFIFAVSHCEMFQIYPTFLKT